MIDVCESMSVVSNDQNSLVYRVFRKCFRQEMFYKRLETRERGRSLLDILISYTSQFTLFNFTHRQNRKVECRLFRSNSLVVPLLNSSV